MRPDFKEVFVFVLGKTPQVITETIYCLMQQQPPIVPHRIYILTTTEGKRTLEAQLLGSGPLEGLFREFGHRPLPREDLQIIVFRARDGTPLSDIRTSQDNEAVGDFITTFIKDLARDPRVRLHCSLVGGRKTMGFYLGMALSFFGRPWDKLYHVLVDPKLESRPDFFYPSPQRPEGESVSLIDLADLPFVRLRDRIDLTQSGFRQLVQEGQRAIDLAIFQEPVRINLRDSSLTIGGRRVSLSPVLLAFYRVFLLQKVTRCRNPERPYCGPCSGCFLSLTELSGPSVYNAVLEGLRGIYGPGSGRAENFKNRWQKRGGIDQDVILQYVSKVNRAFRIADLGIPYRISPVGKRYKRYGIYLDRSLIRVM
ncbi:MAG: TIGR02584 family CRISPR-associated protein [Deltaproteobacteria bacterium]|nr:MAG: TIGR02584 family CRISPR-associated protein [Deltaproteobacteria bacterium]